MDKRVTDLRRQEWEKLIREANNSGMSKTAWCEQNNISRRKFYYWQKVIRDELLEQCEPEKTLSPTTLEYPASSSPDFFEIEIPQVSESMPIALSRNGNESGIEMRYGNLIFYVNSSTSEDVLKKVIRVLSDA